MKSNPFLAFVLALTAETLAHDTWLVASKNTAAVNEQVRVALATGEEFPQSEVAPHPQRVAQFIAVHGGEVHALEGMVEEKELAAKLTLDKPGAYVVAIALHANFIELKAEDFEQYLRDEAAAAALEKWRSRAQPEAPARELYTKFSKTFIEAGHSPAPGVFSTPVGHGLEIIPLGVACGWPKGAEQRLRVLLEGKLAAGVRVSFGHEGLPPHTYVEHLVTDAAGEVKFVPKKEGLWFARAHVIRPLAEPKAAPNDPEARKADWESFWASITFRVAS